MTQPEARFVFPLLIVGVSGIGFAPVLAKLAVNLDGGSGINILSPVSVAFWRMALSFPVFLALHKLRKSPDAEAQPKFSFALLLPGVIFAIDLSLWHWSFEYTSVANSTLLANLSVIFVTFAGWFFFKERIGLLFVAGVAFALVGVARLVGAGFSSGGTTYIGDFLGIATAFAYASYQLTIKKLSARYSVKTLMLWSTGISSLCLMLTALMTPGYFFPRTMNAWTAVVLLALCSQIVGQALVAYGLSRLPVSLTGVTLVLQPVLAAIWGWIILGQHLATRQITDCLIVVLGIGLAKVASGKVKQK